MIDRQALGVGEQHVELGMWATDAGLDDFGARPAVEAIRVQPRGEPMLQGQPAGATTLCGGGGQGYALLLRRPGPG